jgi:hypothetical protein
MRLLRPARGSAWLLLCVTAAWSGSAVAQPSTTPAWVGQFSDFNSADWKKHWGIIPDTLICNIAEGTAPCNWGYPNLKAIDDATTPGGGQALEVTYRRPAARPRANAGSAARRCTRT